jgi:hypothetical protein
LWQQRGMSLHLPTDPAAAAVRGTVTDFGRRA